VPIAITAIAATRFLNWLRGSRRRRAAGLPWPDFGASVDEFQKPVAFIRVGKCAIRNQQAARPESNEDAFVDELGCPDCPPIQPLRRQVVAECDATLIGRKSYRAHGLKPVQPSNEIAEAPIPKDLGPRVIGSEQQDRHSHQMGSGPLVSDVARNQRSDHDRCGAVRHKRPPDQVIERPQHAACHEAMRCHRLPVVRQVLKRRALHRHTK